MNPKPITSVAGLVAMQWKAGQRQLAKSTEKTIIDTQGLIEFSCNTAEILEAYITNDPESQKLKEHVMLLQKERDSVLISGPTGTGKEMIARALHGSRSGKFIAVNCTTLPDQLIESELFGHKKGSFTGAVDDRPGKFEAAWNGTIFLDEIGDMPLNMQTKLLRVLQDKKITPVGGNIEQDISSVRVVAATNKTIEELLERKHFREDLYYRLSTFVLKTKGLLDRLCDVEDIVDSLGGEKLVEEWQKSGKKLEEFFRLEGNVRSLQAQVRRWQVLGEY